MCGTKLHVCTLQFSNIGKYLDLQVQYVAVKTNTRKLHNISSILIVFYETSYQVHQILIVKYNMKFKCLTELSNIGSTKGLDDRGHSVSVIIYRTDCSLLYFAFSF